MKSIRKHRLFVVLVAFTLICSMFITFASAAQERDNILVGDIITNGARIRSAPVNGTVVGLAYIGDQMVVVDAQIGTDGYWWYYGPIYNVPGAPTYGWIREDLVFTYWA